MQIVELALLIFVLLTLIRIESLLSEAIRDLRLARDEQRKVRGIVESVRLNVGVSLARIWRLLESPFDPITRAPRRNNLADKPP